MQCRNAHRQQSWPLGFGFLLPLGTEFRLPGLCGMACRKVCRAFSWLTINTGGPSLLGRGATPGQVILRGTGKPLRRPQGASHYVTFLHGFCFSSHLLLTPLVFDEWLWYGHVRPINPFLAKFLLVMVICLSNRNQIKTCDKCFHPLRHFTGLFWTCDHIYDLILEFGGIRETVKCVLGATCNCFPTLNSWSHCLPRRLRTQGSHCSEETVLLFCAMGWQACHFYWLFIDFCILSI